MTKKLTSSTKLLQTTPNRACNLMDLHLCKQFPQSTIPPTTQLFTYTLHYEPKGKVWHTWMLSDSLWEGQQAAAWDLIKTPMMWNYFCAANTRSYSNKNKNKFLIQICHKPWGWYPNVDSPPALSARSWDEFRKWWWYWGRQLHSRQLQNWLILSHTDLNDLAEDLEMPKIYAELPGSCLKAKNTLAPGTSFSSNTHHKEFP